MWSTLLTTLFFVALVIAPFVSMSMTIPASIFDASSTLNFARSSFSAYTTVVASFPLPSPKSIRAKFLLLADKSPSISAFRRFTNAPESSMLALKALSEISILPKKFLRSVVSVTYELPCALGSAPVSVPDVMPPFTP